MEGRSREGREGKAVSRITTHGNGNGEVEMCGAKFEKRNDGVK